MPTTMMSSEEVKKLKPKKLRETLAEAVGWRHIFNPAPDPRTRRRKKGWENPNDVYYGSELWEWSDLPDYARSMDAAMELVEFMRNKQWKFTLTSTPGFWFASFAYHDPIERWHESPSMAICLAFMAAKDVNLEVA